MREFTPPRQEAASRVNGMKQPLHAATLDEPWAAHARNWSRLGAPLRPNAEDVKRLHAAWTHSLEPAILSSRKIDVLILGVTPELVSHRWAPKFQLCAVDASEAMIKEVWPGDTNGRKAFCGSWLNAPFVDNSFDLIVSDCGLTPLAAPGQVAAFGKELRRLIRNGGRIVMRHFAPAANPIQVEQLVQLAESGALRNFHELKLRFLLALSATRPAVHLGDAWERFNRHFPDRGKLAERLDCPLETISTIDAYRNRDTRYAFPTLPELARQFRDFSLGSGPAATYPLGECCPVISLTPNP